MDSDGGGHKAYGRTSTCSEARKPPPEMGFLAFIRTIFVK